MAQDDGKGNLGLGNEKNALSCQNCQKRLECVEICPEVEKLLNANQAKNGYSDRHYRRKTSTYDSQTIEGLANSRAFHWKYNWHIYLEKEEVL